MAKPLNPVEWPGMVTLEQLKSRCADIQDDRFWRLYDKWREQTLIPPERLFASYSALRGILENDIEGDIVECGTFRGGSFCFLVDAAHEISPRKRTFWAYDTFNGFPDGVADMTIRGPFAREHWHTDDFSGLFRNNLRNSSADEGQIRIVSGSVLDTVPTHAPDKIAFLHLDTDYYESTHHELLHLYGRVATGGAVMVDDYGHFEGARRAVDEFVEKISPKPVMLRADYAGRILLKLHPGP